MNLTRLDRPLRRRLLAWMLAVAALPAAAQTATSPVELTGTLRKVHASGAITLGYRADAVPFSYLSPRGEPIGYTIDLCRLLVDRINEELGVDLEIRWKAVTADTRLQAVTSGEVDAECGTTTNNLERQKIVAFSPTIFVSGTKLMVRKGSPVRSYRDLAGRRVAVTMGTTNERAMRDIAARLGVALKLAVAPDHATAFGMLKLGEVDAFATDDVLLYGLLAQNRLQADYTVTGDYLSYDPYGIVFRKDDPQFARLVGDTFRTLAQDDEIARRYKRWFLRKLPQSGVSLDLPMSPQMETILQTLAARPE